jgi:hypothetical protein
MVDTLTQATTINQSSAVRLLNMANLDTSLAATKTEASANVVVVTTNTASPRECFPPKSAISIRSIVAMEGGFYVMAVVESKYPYLLSCAGSDSPNVQCSTHTFVILAAIRASGPSHIQRLSRQLARTINRRSSRCSIRRMSNLARLEMSS